MSVATTIQISREENQYISKLKRALGLKTKKAVIREGLRVLDQQLEENKRRRQLQEASLKVRKSSIKSNREWAPGSSAIKSV